MAGEVPLPAPEAPDFACTLPDDGQTVRRGQLCELGTATEAVRITGINAEARMCRVYVESDGGYERVGRGATIEPGQTLSGYCKARFNGDVMLGVKAIEKVEPAPKARAQGVDPTLA